MEPYTIEEYLRGRCGFDIPDTMLKSVLHQMKIDAGMNVEELDEKQKDLAEAELLWVSLSIPSVQGSVEDADGNWKHKEGQKEFTVNDRKLLLKRINYLRKKWGMGKLGGTKVSIHSSGIQKIWH